MNPKPKIMLVNAVLTFRITEMGERAFPNLFEHARPALRSLGLDLRNVRDVIITPDAEDPDLHVLELVMR